jgi:hypothetical protein
MKRLVKGVGYDLYETSDSVSLVISGTAEAADDSHPFKVTLKGLKFKVVPGTVNSKMPTLDGTALDAATAPEKTISATGHVYLKCAHSAPTSFPSTITVEYDTTVPADSDTYAYVDLAEIAVSSGKAVKMSQPVRTSLYGERLKCGSSTAQYFFSRA